MKRVGLVVEGGGMRGVYSAGVMDCFLDAKISFPYCIGVSAGSGNLVSFISGQKGRNYRYYKHHAKNKNYMSIQNLMRNGSFFGLEYIYDTLTNNLDALDYDALLHTMTVFKIVATRADNGEPTYFNNTDIDYYDSRPLMASCAVPVVCQPVVIDEVEYFDGGVTDPIPYKKALEDGCENLVVILSRKRGFVKQPENFRRTYTRLLQKYPSIIKTLDERHKVYNDTLAQLEILEQEGRAVIIAPSVDVKMSMFNNNPQLIDNLYESAVNDAEEALDNINNLFKITKGNLYEKS